MFLVFPVLTDCDNKEDVGWQSMKFSAAME